jgi:2-polyprenyl-3-methyl-5-hydroxy-6-metoxy-1,4-benzoquinol methylase
MFDKREDCPACGHLTFQNFLICPDHSVTGVSFALVQCQHCSHVFTNPKPDKSQLPNYYKSNQYISHTNRALNPVQWIYKLVRSQTVKNKEKLIRRLINKTGSLLDFGCGTGHFLNYCAERNWKVLGIEPDNQARKIAKENGNTILDSLDSTTDHFDIITAWHVLEHVPEPKDTLQKLLSKLNPSGKIVLGLPNHKSLDAIHYSSFWAGYDVPRHLSHFNKKSVKELASRLKLKIEAILPMHYDAYYVSMLSEKYMGNRLSPVKGFLTGKKSNTAAAKTGEYSSLIYILSK